MGVAIARNARDRGAVVTLIAAHLEVPFPSGVEVIPVSTADEMRQAALTKIDSADFVFAAAAVSDFRVATVSPNKLKKRDGVPVIELAHNPDILEELCLSKGDRVIVGFAAETDETQFENELAAKASSKGADFFVGNIVGSSKGFGNRDTRVIVLDRAGQRVGEFTGPKSSVAEQLLSCVNQQKASHT